MRLIKLLCPPLSKIVPIMAWVDQRLDLGSIARAFGLDPVTVKINGHFISRGVDLIASSVTWKSLLSFFSARGVSTGDSDSASLIVEGKLSKVTDFWFSFFKWVTRHSVSRSELYETSSSRKDFNPRPRHSSLTSSTIEEARSTSLPKAYLESQFKDRDKLLFMA
ncbi:hypothetical protein RND71_013468 [Anisodus tanguticus]|uniref:Uncharacterized protein n=1 Tax=Anisodus tanguticus TaxID=243964 RepID=A0AAE1VDB4_9SOLA|nr:hypothetical protein RND71_013468 [Anisodus tanguticus]